MWQSSNPALGNDDAFEQYYGKEMFAETRPTEATLQGVVNKTGILVSIAVVAGAAGYALLATMPSILWLSAIVAFVVALGIFFVIYGKPQTAVFLGPVYAIVEGVFLGALSGALEGTLQSRGIAVPGGIALQALVVTIGILLAMLGLYKARIVRPNNTFVAIVSTLTLGVMIVYVLSFLLSLFGFSMPLISLASASEGGTAAWIGLGINGAILVLASLWLLIDFRMIEEKIAAGGAPRYMEWYGGFALMVSLVWIYFETLKLLFRLYMIFGSRD